LWQKSPRNKQITKLIPFSFFLVQMLGRRRRCNDEPSQTKRSRVHVSSTKRNRNHAEVDDTISQMKRLCIQQKHVEEKHNEDKHKEAKPLPTAKEQKIPKIDIHELASDMVKQRTKKLEECFDIIGLYLSTSCELVTRALQRSSNNTTCRNSSVQAYSDQLEMVGSALDDLLIKLSALRGVTREEHARTIRILSKLQSV
jgi:hypothetical protein